MEPKLKAQALIHEISLNILTEIGLKLNMTEILELAKKCASVTVDQILKQDKGAFNKEEAEYHFEYWGNVLDEIDNFKS